MDEPRSVDELRRWVSQHVEGLRLAGVQWLPHGPSVSITLSEPDKAAAPDLASQRNVRMETAGPVEPDLFADPQPKASQAPLALEERRVALDVLRTEVAGCSLCGELASTRKQTVFADGRIGAELCLVGEAPGADEDAQGLPFVGAAGQLLNRILAACGMKREEVYICNVLKCRPPKNRTPSADEIGNCRDFFIRQLELLRPKFIVALGGTAAKALLGTDLSLGRLRGKFHDFHGIPVMVTYHPSFLLPHRSPEKKRDVWEDMQRLMARMGREIPGKKGDKGP
jgi:DNA polymerase